MVSVGFVEGYLYNTEIMAAGLFEDGWGESERIARGWFSQIFEAEVGTHIYIQCGYARQLVDTTTTLQE